MTACVVRSIGELARAIEARIGARARDDAASVSVVLRATLLRSFETSAYDTNEALMLELEPFLLAVARRSDFDRADFSVGVAVGAGVAVFSLMPFKKPAMREILFAEQQSGPASRRANRLRVLHRAIKKRNRKRRAKPVNVQSSAT